MSSQTTIIEVNGVKLEVDLRSAKRIDTLRVGDRVKCLVTIFNNEMNVYPGVVIGFEPFDSLPTIVVAYLLTNYNGVDLVFKSFNSRTKDFEIVADIDNNTLEVNKENILDRMTREEEKLESQLRELQQKRGFFLKNFSKYFAFIEKTEA